MDKKYVCSIIKKEFAFVQSEYCFQTLMCLCEDWGCLYSAANQTTGLEIEYEWQEGNLHIILYRLIDGKIVNNTTNAMKNNEPLNGFSLDWVIALKNPDAQIKRAYEYGTESGFFDNVNGFSKYAALVAKRLKKYAGDILAGDFFIFEKLDKMVKESHKRYSPNRIT